MWTFPLRAYWVLGSTGGGCAPADRLSTPATSRAVPLPTLLAGQEVGTQTYLVHDAVTAAGTTLLSFNAQQLRMIAASRKKTDRRDAYWIAKALQSGMYPHPVYVPTGEIRELRALLSQRRSCTPTTTAGGTARGRTCGRGATP